MKLDKLPGLEVLRVMEELITTGLELSSRSLKDELLEEYENMSDSEKCVVDCEGVALVAVATMYEVLFKHKRVIEKLQKSGVPLRDQEKKSVLQLVKNEEQKELN